MANPRTRNVFLLALGMFLLGYFAGLRGLTQVRIAYNRTFELLIVQTIEKNKLARLLSALTQQEFEFYNAAEYECALAQTTPYYITSDQCYNHQQEVVH